MPYSTGLCDCCSDTGSCLDVFFCGCCHISRVLNALNFQPDTCSCLCPLCLLCHVCTSQELMAQRFADGELNNGCCTVLFCGGCVVCQTSRELTMRNMNPGGTCCKSAITPSLPAAITPQQMIAMQQQRQQTMLHQPNASGSAV